MAGTNIEWASDVWNPTTGCDRVSPGCANCYALTLAKRLKAMGQPRYQRDGDPRTSGPGFGLSVHPDSLDLPLRWRKPRLVFVNSMSDLFHEEVPDRFIAEVFDVMRRAPRHTFQVLTKRPERAREWFERWASAFDRFTDTAWPLPNVWMGVSIENARFTWRADVLREIPAAVRFISAEPLLGSLYDVPSRARPNGELGTPRELTASRPDSLQEAADASDRARHRAPLDLSGIDWIIIGGESGPGARPFHVEHAREIIRACDPNEPVCCGDQSSGECCGEPARRGDVEAVPAVFVKQLGARPVVDYDVDGHPCSAPVFGISDRKGGDWTEWDKVPDLRVREFPRSAVHA